MSGDRELRERLEALQSGIKQAREALSAGVPAEHLAELERLSTAAADAQAANLELEQKLATERDVVARLREEVTRAEQNLLGPQASKSVPALTALFTLGCLAAGLWATTWIHVMPREPLMLIPAGIAALFGPITVAFVYKRRLMPTERPKLSQRS